MSEIVKTLGIVLSKLEYGDSSKIARIYTKDKGKISVMAKAARSAKSKTGKIIERLNLIELVYYDKPTREIQIVSDASLVEHFPNIREDFGATIYATAITELVDKLIHAEEINERLFRGIVRILQLTNASPERAQIFFAKFLFFFAEILGYELLIDKCNKCGRELRDCNNVSFGYQKGLLCGKCAQEEIVNFSFGKEHYKIMKCLTSRDFDCEQNDKKLSEIISFLEKYLAYQIEEFAEIKTLKLIIN